MLVCAHTLNEYPETCAQVRVIHDFVSLALRLLPPGVVDIGFRACCCNGAGGARA